MMRLVTNLKLNAFIWLLFAVTSVYVCISQFKDHSPLQTNLLALLPATERNPVAEVAVRKLADSAGNRAIFLIGADSPDKALVAAKAFANQLRASSQQHSPTFHQVLLELPPIDIDQITHFYSLFQYQLLDHQDRLALQQQQLDLSHQLQQKIYAPFQFGMTLPLEKDPFGLSDRWFASLPLKHFKLDIEDGVLMGHTSTTTWVFISADPVGSAYSNAIQDQVIQVVSNAESALKHSHPDAKVLRTGAIFYAHHARTSAEQEMHIIGLVSLAGMLLLLYLVFRSVLPLALGFLSIGFGICTAVAATIHVYGDIHLITLVFGASLIGEAIDYPIQYFSAHLGAGKNWSPLSGLRRVTPALSLALFTSLLGYAALSFMPFPALAQIAFFAFVGLMSAWISVYLLLPATLTKANQRNPETAVAIPHRFLTAWKAKIKGRTCLIAGAVMMLFSIPGLLKLSGNDDIRILIAQPKTLLTQETQIREIAGLGNNNQFFLVEGHSQEEVLRNEEKLTTHLDQWVQQGALKAYTAISTFVPSQATQTQNQALWQSIITQQATLNTTLAEAGVRDEVATNLINDFNRHHTNRLHLADWLNAPFSTPFRKLWLGKTPQGDYASIVLLQDIQDSHALKQLSDKLHLPSITYVDKAGSVSALFHDYRYWSSLWLVAAFVLIFAILSLRYGPRISAIVLTPTLLAITVTLGVMGYLNIPLSFFHMMGLLLVLGVGVNYAIFMREGFIQENKTLQAASLGGVLLSAGTTLLSYGMLIFSSMPVLSNFGLTMLLGVGIAALLSLMVLSFD